MPNWTRQAFPLPPIASDSFPAPTISAKHSRWVLCPDDGKFYIFGGDYGSTWQGGSNQSGVNATLAYHPPTQAWEIAYPFCGIEGEAYPAHMDEVAVCWDTKRKRFWVTGGYQGGQDPCVGGGIKTIGKVFTFDPVTRRYAMPFGQLSFGYGSSNRSVYDPVRDRIFAPYYNGSFGTALNEFNPNTGKTIQRQILGIGNFYPTHGETVFLFGDKLYFIGGPGGTTRQFVELDIPTLQAKVWAILPMETYSDQDISHIPALDSFLVWTEEPKAYLIERSTGTITNGPASPPLGSGAGYRPQHNNYHPSGVVVIGWSAGVPPAELLPEYWHYSLSNAGPQSSTRKQGASAIRATITTTPQAFPIGTKPASYRFGISGPQNRFVDVSYGGGLEALFDDMPEGNYTITVELLDSAGMRLGNLLSEQVTVAQAEIVLQGLFGLTPGIRIRRGARRTSESSED